MFLVDPYPNGFGGVHANVDDACVVDDGNTNREGIVKAYSTAIDENIFVKLTCRTNIRICTGYGGNYHPYY